MLPLTTLVLVLLPVLSIKSPLAPDEPAEAVCSVSVPLLVAVPTPDAIVTLPPVDSDETPPVKYRAPPVIEGAEDDVFPAVIEIAPPDPVFPEPAVTYTAPPEPPVATPEPM